MTGVSQILQQMAANAAQQQIARGNTYASLIQGISNVPAQIIDDRERQQQIDLQRAGEAQRLAIANRADQRAQADQAYQDHTRALEVDKQIKTRAILQAYTGGTPNDPSTNDLAAGIAKAKEVGLPEMIPSLWELHQKEQQFRNPRPYETDPTKDQRDPNTNAIITPGQPKMPEIGSPAYGIATRIRDLEGTGAPAPAGAAPGMPILPPPPLALPVAPANAPPASSTPPGRPGAPATTAAPPIAAGPGVSGVSDVRDTPPPSASGAPPVRLTHAQAVAKAYADAEAAKDPHSAIYKEWQDYSKQGGTLGFDAYMTMDANRKKPVVSLSGMNALYQDVDPKAIAQAIRDGREPPDISSYGRPVSAAISSELQKPDPVTGKKFDRYAAMNQYGAVKRLSSTLNGTNQVRYDESIRSGLAMYDKVDELATQWDSKGWGPLSQVNLAAARAGLKGKDAASLANQLTSQIGQLTSDVATLEQGGLTPTTESRHIAEQSMKDWWGTGTIHDLTAQGRYNMQIRHLARGEVQPMVPGNPQNTQPATPATPPGGAAVGTYPGAPGAGGAADLNTRAAAVLQQNGRASDPASVATFLRNNPTFK